VPCPTCGATARRVPEVIDTWYDSGAMPFAQWGYHPDLGRGINEFEAAFPADFISEAIDQTRGWFYTLMAEGVLHFDETAYRNVVCLGHLVAEDGRKMSKSLGNQFDPWAALDRQGADALRWWMLTNGSPWESRRIGHEILDDNVRQFLLPLWNVFSFFVTYANASDLDVDTLDVGTTAVLDRWLASQLAGTVREVRERMDAYDATAAGRRLQAFVDDLSTWYVRRSRRRFWNPGGVDADTIGAFRTLHTCLVTLAQLLAPFTPFVAEAIWRTLAAGRADRPDSVHLSDYPEVHEHLLDPGLDTAMAHARQVVELGRRIRVDAKIRTRQPLAEAIAHVPGRSADVEGLLPIVAEELNVKQVRLATSSDRFGAWRAKPDFKVLGPRLGARVQALAATLADDDGAVASQLAAGATVDVSIDDGPAVTVGPDDVDITRDALAGWGVASDGGVTVALELALTDELRSEGLARELVRIVQDARKAAGLAVGDRIALGIDGDAPVVAARDAWGSFIAEETLATELDAAIPDPTATTDAEVDGHVTRVQLRRTQP
jgi:isoleucyl-tRNA synthetase